MNEVWGCFHGGRSRRQKVGWEMGQSRGQPLFVNMSCLVLTSEVGGFISSSRWVAGWKILGLENPNLEQPMRFNMKATFLGASSQGFSWKWATGSSTSPIFSASVDVGCSKYVGKQSSIFHQLPTYLVFWYLLISVNYHLSICLFSVSVTSHLWPIVILRVLPHLPIAKFQVSVLSNPRHPAAHVPGVTQVMAKSLAKAKWWRIWSHFSGGEKYG